MLTCDIPGAFMQAKFDEIMHIRFDGEILDALLCIELQCHRSVA
jgi:hypothetical protein